ncbi:MAG TPA: GHKL domain-containing protein [Candidatus Eubacterium avistercoris]|uniref:GHKL domain-containing protein n=1 Tax=Candidatus Eubacterium avistercoris TaxID=2838567 RepID=A0A9D2D3P5_9FIRM|nr:GHKL domain-containing protein [Candidatus Eubacterium avistercoris]
MLIWGTAVLMLATLLLLFNGWRMKILEKENRLLSAYMDTAQEFYQEIQKRMEASSRYRHDLAKHIQTLESLLAQREDGEEVRTYMEGLKKEYAKLKKKKFCRDEILESILDMKEQQCQELGIPIEISVEDCFYREIEEVDMVGLICNLLDNAIEANERCAKEERRGIWFRMDKKEEKIEIEIENCMSLEEEFNFITKKSKKNEHGIGTKIIESLVEKYQGTREIKEGRQRGIITDKIFLYGKARP